MYVADCEAMSKMVNVSEIDTEEDRMRAALARVSRGDETALEELYRAYAPAVFAFSLSRAPNREIAEEVAADAWLGCWRSARSFRGDSRVLTWLLGIAKRQVYVHTRRKRLVEVPLDDSVCEIPGDEEDALDRIAGETSVAEMLAALDALPAELSETVRLAWLHELPYSEIAAVTEVPTGTVKSRISRARRLLKEILGGGHEKRR